MNDNTTTELRKSCDPISRLLEVRKSQILGTSTERAARAAIHALEGTQPPRLSSKSLLWVQALLAGRPDRIRRDLGVRKQVFEQLVQELSIQGFTHSEGIALEIQLAIFLYICATGLSCRIVGERINLPCAMVKRHFCKILEALSSPSIFTKYVRLPSLGDSTTLACLTNDPLYPFFKDAIGAMDCMQVVCAPPGTTKSAYRNRRGFYSQHCLVCCNFNLEFIHIVSGWEGGATDRQVYWDDHATDLCIPAGKYCLADLAFPPCTQLVPYAIQHDLPRSKRGETRPTNAQEYFNLRHGELKNVVEQAIYALKRRFKILTVVPEFDMHSQARIPPVLCCIHNIICRLDPDDIEKDKGPSSITIKKSEDVSFEENGPMAGSGSDGDGQDTMVGKWKLIASLLWKDYRSQVTRMNDEVIVAGRHG